MSLFWSKEGNLVSVPSKINFDGETFKLVSHSWTRDSSVDALVHTDENGIRKGVALMEKGNGDYASSQSCVDFSGYTEEMFINILKNNKHKIGFKDSTGRYKAVFI